MAEHMPEDKWDQAQNLFLVAADLPPADRARFLDEACLGDPALRSEVEGWIKADLGSEAFLESLVRREASRLLASALGKK
jgi:hypothetical protein